jgi:predicted nucleotidyltransferase
VLDRLSRALNSVAEQAARTDGVTAIAIFGSYARAEHGLKSDVDLLVLVADGDAGETARRGMLEAIGEAEVTELLPMHLAPLVVQASRPDDLGPSLLHSLWSDGVILFARAGWLARLQPTGLAPFALVRFASSRASPSERVRLSRKLHGTGGRRGILGPGSLTLGPGVLLLPAGQLAPIRAALDEAGSSYDVIAVWREV